MSLRSALATLCVYWSDVFDRLGEDQQTFRVLTGNVVDNRDDTRIQVTLMRLLSEVLPDDHPVLRALDDEDDRSPEETVRWAHTITELARRLGR